MNKIVSYLVNNFSLVSFQNDNVHSWSKRFGRKVQNTGIAKLKTLAGTKTPTKLTGTMHQRRNVPIVTGSTRFLSVRGYMSANTAD